jgi:hypothetical protein
MKNIFEKSVTDEVIARIEKLSPETQPQWGKMGVAQMFAHLSVAYEFVYTDKHKATKATGFKKFMIKLFAKNMVCGEKPYPKNGRTAPQFIITEEKVFAESAFDGKESHSFGPLNKTEWNNMFYKHADHHLTQFGV